MGRCWAEGTDIAGAAVPHGSGTVWYHVPTESQFLPWFLSYALPLIPTLRDGKEDRHR